MSYHPPPPPNEGNLHAYCSVKEASLKEDSTLYDSNCMTFWKRPPIERVKGSGVVTALGDGWKG